MIKKKEQWEEEAKDRFIACLESQGRGVWIVSDTDVVVDQPTNRNFDYQLHCETGFIALEIFRLVESQEEIVRQKSWSKISDSIATELRKRGIKGYTILTPHVFDVPRIKIHGYVSKIAERLEAVIKQNAQTDLIRVDGFEIKRIEDFPDVSLYTIGPGGPVNPTGIARNFMAEKLPTKNKQLNIAKHERIVLIVNWSLLVGRSDMIEACSLIDFSMFENIDKAYFLVPQNEKIDLVYDRKIYEAFRPDGQPPEQIEPLFISWLANHLYRKSPQAFHLVRKITEQQKSLRWLPALSREQLVALGEDFLQSGDSEELHWVVDNLKDDPDPSVENAPDDVEGKFNCHLRVRRGENSRLIHSVRGRLCWLLMQIVTHPRIKDYERVFEIVEKFATDENLYVRQQATVPLIELARRRFARVDGTTRFMSDDLAIRVKALALRMVDENIAFPAVSEWVAHVVVHLRDLDQVTAERIIGQLLCIHQWEAASSISSIVIYFGFFRENNFKELEPFDSGHIRTLLKDRLAHGSGQFRATAAEHFKTILESKEIDFDTLAPYVEALIIGKPDRVVNHHFYQIAAKQAADHPNTIGRLVERVVIGELQSLESGGREVWHPKEFSKTLQVLEEVADHKELVARIRRSIQPYREKGRLYDVYDF